MAMTKSEDVSFMTTDGFCSDCGSLLPLLGDRGGVTCYACGRKWAAEGKYLDNFLFKISKNTINFHPSPSFWRNGNVVYDKFQYRRYLCIIQKDRN